MVIGPLFCGIWNIFSIIMNASKRMLCLGQTLGLLIWTSTPQTCWTLPTPLASEQTTLLTKPSDTALSWHLIYFVAPFFSNTISLQTTTVHCIHGCLIKAAKWSDPDLIPPGPDLSPKPASFGSRSISQS